MTGATQLSQAIQSLSRLDLLVDSRTIAIGDENALLEAEAASMAQASVEKRRASGAARIVARALLARMGLPPSALPKGPSGAPAWPVGIVGSLAHDATIAVAAVGQMRNVRCVGIDIEPAEALAPDMIALVVTPAELRRIADDPLQARVLFTAKEAIYKALHPVDGRFLEYHDISVDLPGQRAITRQGRAIDLRFCISTHIVALAVA